MATPHPVPQHGIVFDIETKPHPKVRSWLGTDEKIARLDGMDEDGLRSVAVANEIKLGNRVDPGKIKEAIRGFFQKQADQAALRLYGTSIASIACREVAGAHLDLDTIYAGEELEEEWPGKVWCVTDEFPEGDVLINFFDWLKNYAQPVCLMGFNIRGNKPGRKGYDIPVMRARCAMLGVTWPSWLPSTISQDRFHTGLWDICDVLHEGPCDTWLRMAGLPPKTASGSKVADMTTEELIGYNSNDVELERLLCALVLPTQDTWLQDLLHKEAA